MNQKSFIQISLLIIVIGGLLFIAQPTQASFFDWFSWSRVKSVFIKEQIQESLPASVLEPIEGVSSAQKEPQKTSEETQAENQEYPICERSQCPVCPQPQACESIVKEVPAEKIVYRENVIYKENPDCKLSLIQCNEQRKEVFDLYYKNQNEIGFCISTTTDFKANYMNLLNQFETLITLTFNLNRDYLFQPQLSARLSQFTDFASTSHAFIERFK